MWPTFFRELESCRHSFFSEGWGWEIGTRYDCLCFIPAGTYEKKKLVGHSLIIITSMSKTFHQPLSVQFTDLCMGYNVTNVIGLACL